VRQPNGGYSSQPRQPRVQDAPQPWRSLGARVCRCSDALSVADLSQIAASVLTVLIMPAKAPVRLWPTGLYFAIGVRTENFRNWHPACAFCSRTRRGSTCPPSPTPRAGAPDFPSFEARFSPGLLFCPSAQLCPGHPERLSKGKTAGPALTRRLGSVRPSDRNRDSQSEHRNEAFHDSLRCCAC
jgi:hypothetical protein